MLPLLHLCVSAANIRKIIFVYQLQRTVAYFMQIMRPATDVSYELHFFDVPLAYLFFYPWLMPGVHVALLWQIILMCKIPVLRFFMALVWHLFSLY